MDIQRGDIVIEKDSNGTAMGHVVSVGPVWVTVHWLIGVGTHTPGGTWSCPTDEAHEAIESGEWQLHRDHKNIQVVNGKLFMIEDSEL